MPSGFFRWGAPGRPACLAARSSFLCAFACPQIPRRTAFEKEDRPQMPRHQTEARQSALGQRRLEERRRLPVRYANHTPLSLLSTTLPMPANAMTPFSQPGKMPLWPRCSTPAQRRLQPWSAARPNSPGPVKAPCLLLQERGANCQHPAKRLPNYSKPRGPLDNIAGCTASNLWPPPNGQVAPPQPPINARPLDVRVTGPALSDTPALRQTFAPASAGQALVSILLRKGPLTRPQ